MSCNKITALNIPVHVKIGTIVTDCPLREMSFDYEVSFIDTLPLRQISVGLTSR